MRLRLKSEELLRNASPIVIGDYTCTHYAPKVHAENWRRSFRNKILQISKQISDQLRKAVTRKHLASVGLSAEPYA